MYAPPRLGAKLSDAYRHAGFFIENAIGRVGIARVNEEILDVGGLELFRRFDETVNESGTQGQYAFALQIVAGNLTGQRQAARHFIQRCRRWEEHTSALQSLMRNSYAVFCLNKKITRAHNTKINDKVYD